MKKVNKGSGLPSKVRYSIHKELCSSMMQSKIDFAADYEDDYEIANLLRAIAALTAVYDAVEESKDDVLMSAEEFNQNPDNAVLCMVKIVRDLYNIVKEV